MDHKRTRGKARAFAVSTAQRFSSTLSSQVYDKRYSCVGAMLIDSAAGERVRKRSCVNEFAILISGCETKHSGPSLCNVIRAANWLAALSWLKTPRPPGLRVSAPARNAANLSLVTSPRPDRDTGHMAGGEGGRGAAASPCCDLTIAASVDPRPLELQTEARPNLDAIRSSTRWSPFLGSTTCFRSARQARPGGADDER